MLRKLPFFLFLLIVPVFSVAQANGMALRASFSDTVKKVSPSVVNIYTESERDVRAQHPFFNDPFFSNFFGRPLSQGMKQRVERSLGSGVVVTAEGHLLTNYHVVEGAKKVRVIFSDKREMEAEMIGADKNMDIAVLRLVNTDKVKIPFVEFGNSDSLEMGDVVLALGNPFGVGQSVSMGIVSGVGRSNLGTNRYENYIQTDAAINPGNSGGPLVDSLGKLVGINTAIYSKSGGSQGIAFATPANSVKVILNSIVKTGKVTRPWFGATGQNVTSKLARQLDLDRPVGVLVNEIVEDSPAEKAGLELGDIVLKFDGFYIENVGSFNSRIAGSLIGVPYEMTYFRGGEEYVQVIELSGLPERKLSDQITLSGNHPLSGFTFETLSPALAQELGMPYKSSGVAVVEAPRSSGSSFFGMDLRTGDVIVSVNKEDIRNIKDLKKSTSRRPRSWAYVYKRGKQTYRVRVQ